MNLAQALNAVIAPEMVTSKAKRYFQRLNLENPV